MYLTGLRTPFNTSRPARDTDKVPDDDQTPATEPIGEASAPGPPANEPPAPGAEPIGEASAPGPPAEPVEESAASPAGGPASPASRPAGRSVLDPLAFEDRDEAWGDRSGDRDDDWYRRERPPHH
jgi:hypothetical protein